jgi:hypothetical protein
MLRIALVNMWPARECFTEQEDDVDFGGGSAAAAKKTKFSRLAWGLEIWDLLRCCIELMYEPELQVKFPASH